jgi:hypothetical protein
MSGWEDGLFVRVDGSWNVIEVGEGLPGRVVALVSPSLRTPRLEEDIPDAWVFCRVDILV